METEHDPDGKSPFWRNRIERSPDTESLQWDLQYVCKYCILYIIIEFKFLEYVFCTLLCGCCGSFGDYQCIDCRCCMQLLAHWLLGYFGWFLVSWHAFAEVSDQMLVCCYLDSSVFSVLLH